MLDPPKTDIKSHRIFKRNQKHCRDELERGLFKENDLESSTTNIKAETQRLVCEEMKNGDSSLEKRGFIPSLPGECVCVYDLCISEQR